eukprot:508564-Alexandrium_andersonii.AAC.1
MDIAALHDRMPELVPLSCWCRGCGGCGRGVRLRQLCMLRPGLGSMRCLPASRRRRKGLQRLVK